ncbi:MAG: sulfurtransferase [Lysobacterales bacterium]
MYLKHAFRGFLIALSVSFFSSSVIADFPTETIAGVDPELGTLVSTQWLSEHLDDADLVVLDCSVLVEQDENGGMRSVSARSVYEKGHIPGAGFADLTGDLSDNDSPYEFALPTPEKFSAVMGALGVGDDSRVVLYDNFGSGWAARVWWMLRSVGFDRAALLNGGLGAWTAEGRPLSTQAAKQPVRQLTPSPRPGLIADRNEVFESISNDSIHLIDAMPESHYRGEMVLYDWPGHIPGATNTPAFSLLDESGRYLPDDELAALFHGDRDMRTITYCGGGISASSDAFILTRLGYNNVAVYISSLQEWTNDLNNPMEVDTP